MRQYTIEGTKTYTYYKTVQATDIVDAHIKAHEPSEDPDDDWTSHFDEDYDDPIEVVVKNIEDEGEL
tara:strand:+ start:46 stop:246 length:201 start_codon:yes stop_codon:yes gene_type:complete